MYESTPQGKGWFSKFLLQFYFCIQCTEGARIQYKIIYLFVAKGVTRKSTSRREGDNAKGLLKQDKLNIVKE